MAICCAKWQASPYWNIILLALAWALTLSTSTLLTTVGPLSAKELHQSNSLAAFTIGIFLLGAAVSSVPSGWLFRKYGRFWGFTLGCFFQFVGSLLGSLALLTNQAAWLYLGCFSIGLAQGLGQFYRFSAVEVTPMHLKSRAVTYVLSGGIIAAFLGPTTANYSIHIFSEEYLGSYLLVAVFAGLNQLVLMFVNFPPPPGRSNERKIDYSNLSASEGNAQVTEVFNPTSKGLEGVGRREEERFSLTGNQPDGHGGAMQSQEQQEEEEEEDMEDYPSRNSSIRIRSATEIASQPMFILSCAIATLAHTIMVMLMSNVTLAMQDNGYSFGKCSLVMELHFFAMFVPGFMTGRLIEKYGSLMIAFIGGFLFAGSSVILVIDTQMWNYLLGMILLGVAWNFSFSAGTVMLTSCYEPREATEVQAINDFVLFTIAGAGSLLSGFIYSLAGWLVLDYACSGMMIMYLLMFAYAWGGKVMDDGLEEPLLMEDDEAQVPRGSSSTTSDTVRVANPTVPAVKQGSFATPSFRGVSFSSRRDGRQESTDIFTPVRTVSVA